MKAVVRHLRFQTNLVFLVAGLLVAAPFAVHGHVGDHTFLELAEKAAADQEFKRGTSPQATAIAVREFTNSIRTLVGSDGKSLVKSGMFCESVTIEGSLMTVSFTFHKDEKIPVSFADNLAAMYEYLFSVSEGLDEIRIQARIAGETKYRLLSEFVQPAPAIREMEQDLIPEGPGPQSAPDYQVLSQKAVEAGLNAKQVPGPQGAASEPMGALSGRTVYVNAGHGWNPGSSGWYLERPLLLGMNEDYGNLDNVNFLANYLFNAGATVVAMRPLGYQPNTVTVDDVDAVLEPAPSWGSTSSAYNYGNWSSGSTWVARFASATPGETATATYTPNIPVAGLYPIYCYANHGADRISGQLYRIRHFGGEARVRINHRRVGRGWIYLGQYNFAAGSNAATGSVVVSNEAPASGTTTGVVVADAIRFGNGMGTYVGSTGVSGYPRQDENYYYWLRELMSPGSRNANGRSTVSSGAAAEMRRDDGQGFNGDIFLSWHSNAAGCAGGPPCTARGCIGLISTDTVQNQATFATLLSDTVDEQCLAEHNRWEYPWVDRVQKTLTGGYSEISNYYLSSEMCGSLIEVAFHDNLTDARLLRDPRVRDTVARATYAAILKYFTQFDAVPYVLLPDAPERVRAISDDAGNVTVSWAQVNNRLPVAHGASGYRVYRSTDGVNFGSPMVVTGPASTSTQLTGLPQGTVSYFRVAAFNGGGESMPSEVVASRTRTGTQNKVLVVTGYKRLDRFNNVPTNTASPDTTNNERIFLDRNNSYDYVRQHAASIVAAGAWLDSASNEAVASGDVALSDYRRVVWALGEEDSVHQPFTTAERTAVQAYLAAGGAMFISGAEVAAVLQTQDSSFLNNSLFTTFVGNDANTYQAQGVSGTIFDGINFDFSPNAKMYDVDAPDQLGAANGSLVCAQYLGGSAGNAAIQYTGQATTRLVNLGFPFEAISSSASRDQAMTAALQFLDVPVFTSAADWMLFQ